MKSPAKKRFISWLEKQINEKAAGSPLPTDRDLARAFGLSPSTVRQVMTGYRDQGLVERVAGKGTFIPAAAEPAMPEPEGSTADDLADNFRQLISRGTIKNGEPLPPVKTVCLQYRVSATSVTAAYRKLVRMGFAHRTGRRYWAGTFAPFSGTGSRQPVHFLYDRLNSMDIVRTRSGEYFAYLKMERELLTYGYQPFYHPLSELRERENRWLETGDYPAGVVCIVNYENDIHPYINILSRIHAMSGSRTAQLCVTQNTIGTLPGTDIMLIRQHGHTTVFRLLAGFLVRKQYRSAVLFYDTTVLQRWTFGTHLRLWRETHNLDAGFDVRYAVRTRRDVSPGQFMENYIQYAGGTTMVNLGKYGPTRLEDLTRNMACAPSALESFFPDYLDKDVWIFPRSGQADRAISWLERNGIRVPEDILVISLENNPHYLHRTITTITPDWDTIGYTMAHAIIKDIPLARTSRGHLRTAAIIKDYSEISTD